MADIRTNAGQLALTYEQRAAALQGAVRRGVRDVVLTVERNAGKRLTGTGEAGAYPVPVRTGHLRRSLGSRLLGDASGVVFDRARYANAIHSGFRPYGNAHAKRIPARAFLQDAVDETDHMAIMSRRLSAVFA